MSCDVIYTLKINLKMVCSAVLVHLLPAPCAPCIFCSIAIMLFISIPPAAPPCIMLLNIDIGLGASLPALANPNSATPTYRKQFKLVRSVLSQRKLGYKYVFFNVRDRTFSKRSISLWSILERRGK